MPYKKFLLLFFISFSVLLATAQQKTRDYSREWKKIDSLIEKSGLVKTALKEVNAIYASAKKENNEVQVIKALLYRMTLNDQVSEQGKYENIAMLEKEIPQAKEPARSVLHSIAGGSYWHYLQLNRWQFYNRTATTGFKKDDIATWDLSTLYAKINYHYQGSLTEKDLLKKTKLERFDPIIIKGNVRHLRPTLFDLLAHRALDFFRNDERYITKPAYAFEINDSAAFADAAEFVSHKFVTSDSLSLHHKALELFQELIAFHLNDPSPHALIDVDIERLEFVNNFGVHPDKNELYKNALERIITRHEDDPGVTDAIYLLAEWYMTKGRTYDPVGDTTNRYDLVKAKELCERAIKSKDKTEGISNCANLLNEILRKEINLKAEQVNTIGEPFRVLVNYRNFTSGYFRLIRMDRNIREKLGRDTWNDSFWIKALQLPVIRTYIYTLPDTKDHQRHGIEIKVDSLPAGVYGLLASPDKEFSLKNNTLALQQFYISDIAYVNNGMRYHVLNRKSGAPLAEAKIQVWKEEYNYQKKSTVLRKINTYTSDKTGYFELKDSVDRSGNFSLLLDIAYGKDRLFLHENVNNYVYTENYSEPVQDQAFLFSDRSIYRPGQTVFFKGIVVTKKTKTKSPSIIPDRNTSIILYDANEEAVDSVSLTTNVFGSYSGKFSLPANLLNGEFTIRDNNHESGIRIRVEEYKRPKFYVNIAKPKGTYRLNDTILVEGNTTSYAGNNINSASVNYRVVRRTIIPMWVRGYGSKIWPPYGKQEMEIVHGSTVTAANGKFNIKFPAIPDKSIPKEQHPVFYYEVSADVTDINGETRSGNTSVAIGYEAMKLELKIASVLHTDSLNQVKVTTTNMNDSFENAQVKLAIHKLSAPAKIFRERFWDQPDQFIMSREDYYKNFPFDMYADENDRSKWPKEKLVFETSGKTVPDSSFRIIGTTFEAGWYLLEASTKDKYGEAVTDKQYVLLYNTRIVSPIATAKINANKKFAEAGDKINYGLLTNLDSIFIIHEQVVNNEMKKVLVYSVKNPFQSELIMPEPDLGDIKVTMVFVKNNRIYSDLFLIDAPYHNKELKIDYTSFRDKTKPGTKESWKVKISGYKGEKIAAELLTSMYDASLDQFYPHSWPFPSLWRNAPDYSQWKGGSNFTAVESLQKIYNTPIEEGFVKIYDRLKTPDEGGIGYRIRGMSSRIYGARAAQNGAAAELAETQVSFNKEKNTSAGIVSDSQSQQEQLNEPEKQQPPAIQPRKNLNETAFFFPTLYTDSSGNVEFSFTTPEALTTWKWMLFAHTKDLAFGYGEKTMITQKELMVQPNAPRFLREGDRIDLSAKIVNMTNKEITGQAILQLIDPSTGETVDGIFHNISPTQFFTAGLGESTSSTFSINIPFNYNKPVSWRITATSKSNGTSISDGEEAMLPVISNRMLVTESLPLPVRGKQTKTFSFEKLIKSSGSKTLQHHGITVEFTSNPAWYAVQSLPYLTEEKSENAEQVFNRYYANALATKLANSSPRLKEIIEKWKTSDTSAFFSNLQKNEELKSIILQETPWVLEAKTESQQKKNVALLFDMVRMSNELKTTLTKLKDMQSPTGGFVWLKGGPEDRYMTQYILSGIGHLKKLGALPSSSNEMLDQIMRKAILYIDQEIKKDYAQLKKNNKKIPAGTIGSIPVQYLYMRSFFTDIDVPGDVFAAYNYYRNQSKQGWIKENTMLRGMIALSLFRTGDQLNANKIMAALKETAINNEEMGMYWKDMTGGYYWYQAPVETQALMIEAFSEIKKDSISAGDMKTWLLKNKQTNSWKTSKATADACYALLLQGSNWLEEQPAVEIHLGEKVISSENKTEAGTGYFKATISGDSVKPSMGNITIKVESDNKNQGRPAWGSVYWQYFEDLDKITVASTPLKIEKKLFVQQNTDRGPVLHPLDDNNTLHVGDKVKVRIEIRSDRTLEYVHMKDMRASSMEPVNVLSGYKWQEGLGYYESTKDASTSFFFNILPKGVYVFEYDLFVSHTGTFSNGVTTIQCMYAPEFSSHSEGIKVNVEKK